MTEVRVPILNFSWDEEAFLALEATSIVLHKKLGTPGLFFLTVNCLANLRRSPRWTEPTQVVDGYRIQVSDVSERDPRNNLWPCLPAPSGFVVLIYYECGRPGVESAVYVDYEALVAAAKSVLAETPTDAPAAIS